MLVTPKDNMKEIIADNLVLTQTVVDYDSSIFSNYRRLQDEKFGNTISQTELAKTLKLNDASIISRIERGEMGMDNRRFSVFLLITDNHPRYKLKLKEGVNKDAIDLILPTPSASDIKSARDNISGLSQRNLSLLVGLHHKMINKYESSSATSKNMRSPSPHTWTMMLLATKQHPYYELILK